MEQTLVIHIGQAGIQIGIELWKLLMKEHSINLHGEFGGNNDTQYLESVFWQNDDGTYMPRALFCDLDPSTIDKLLSSELQHTLWDKNI